MAFFATFPKGSLSSKNSRTAGSMGLFRANQANIWRWSLLLSTSKITTGSSCPLRSSSLVLDSLSFDGRASSWRRVLEKAWSRCCPSRTWRADESPVIVPLRLLIVPGVAERTMAGIAQ